jgi:hypothetical protein
MKRTLKKMMGSGVCCFSRMKGAKKGKKRTIIDKLNRILYSLHHVIIRFSGVYSLYSFGTFAISKALQRKVKE